jgi:hypothetical protein
MKPMIEVNTAAAAQQLKALIHEIQLFLESLNES